MGYHRHLATLGMGGGSGLPQVPGNLGEGKRAVSYHMYLVTLGRGGGQ